MNIPNLPDAKSRWRCSRCGNLTRFDVIRTERAAEFWHFDLSGAPQVEERQVQVSEILEVKCRWCGTGAAVELVPRVDED